MSDINSSLIGYLKKKSLFSDSPNKSIRLKERSKEKKNLVEVAKTPRNNPQKNLHSFNSHSSQNLHHESSVKNQRERAQSEAQHQSMLIERQTRFFNNNNQSEIRQTATRRNFNFKPQETKSVKNTREEDNTNLWSGLVNYATTFESARIQSIQCLQGMSVKLQAELSNINYKIDIFHSKMTQILNREFLSMKQKIYNIVNKIFEESEQNIRIYIKQQQQILAGQLLEMRETLTKQYQKIQIMKEQINKPNWRKVAGELLSTQLQQKIDVLLHKSRQIDIGHWQMGDLGAGKVTLLQNQLRDMIRLTAR